MVINLPIKLDRNQFKGDKKEVGGEAWSSCYRNVGGHLRMRGTENWGLQVAINIVSEITKRTKTMFMRRWPFLRCIIFGLIKAIERSGEDYDFICTE